MNSHGLRIGLKLFRQAYIKSKKTVSRHFQAHHTGHHRSGVAANPHLDAIPRSRIFQHGYSIHHIKGHIANFGGMQSGFDWTSRHNQVGIPFKKEWLVTKSMNIYDITDL